MSTKLVRCVSNHIVQKDAGHFVKKLHRRLLPPKPSLLLFPLNIVTPKSPD